MSEVAKVLDDYKRSQLSLEDACEALSRAYTVQLGHTTLDLQRERRVGFGEVVYGEGKTSRQLCDIFAALIERRQSVLATRVSAEAALAVCSCLPGTVHDAVARTLVHHNAPPQPVPGRIAVVSAGTSDQHVAEEAAVTAEFYGNDVLRISDVGVAGLHRLFARLDEIRSASVIVAVAGMEGALASVVGGLVRAPVIAVPTSVGYGAAFGGLGALLGMLNSCASGVSVVNIDNGFGGGYMAAIINRLSAGRAGDALRSPDGELRTMGGA
ncbi:MULTISPECIES: nickel pincer cofactor biosynthesis protein LarB [Paraburkholderia]|uniref:Nickel pincer cofactor biosynthesis protein LarB n=1 Tax=Paraburkholderia metrosideri TaxID=580937 RepID=A0ABW9E4U2_9BURK